MMISPRPCCWCSRRAFARISSRPMSDESSMNSGARASRWLASRIFGHLCSATRPLRSSSPLIRAWDATKRWASSVSDISRLNRATGALCSIAAFSAMLHDERRLSHRRARGDDDEVAGLEAAGDLVEVLEARRRAGERGALERQPVELVELVVEDLLDRAEVLLAVVVGDLEHRALGALDEVARRAVAARRRSPGSRTSW